MEISDTKERAKPRIKKALETIDELILETHSGIMDTSKWRHTVYLALTLAKRAVKGE